MQKKIDYYKMLKKLDEETTWNYYNLIREIECSNRQLKTDRHYAIMRPDGTAYGYAVSTWALINIDTRQPVDLSQMPDDQLWQCIVPEREAPIAPPTRLRLQTPELLAVPVPRRRCIS